MAQRPRLSTFSISLWAAPIAARRLSSPALLVALPVSLTLVGGHWPGPGSVVIDSNTASKKHLRVGDMVGVQGVGPVVQLRISGLVKFGSASSLGGITIRAIDPDVGVVAGDQTTAGYDTTTTFAETQSTGSCRDGSMSPTSILTPLPNTSTISSSPCLSTYSSNTVLIASA